MTLGWECPRCHKCYAPFVRECDKCPMDLKVVPPDVVKNFDDEVNEKVRRPTGKAFSMPDKVKNVSFGKCLCGGPLGTGDKCRNCLPDLRTYKMKS